MSRRPFCLKSSPAPAIALVCLSVLAGCSSSTDYRALTPTAATIPLSDPATEAAGAEPARPAAEVAADAMVPDATAANAMVSDNLNPAPVAATAALALVRPSTPARVIGRAPYFADYKPFDFVGRNPTHYPVHGTDTSKWQTDANWASLRAAGISFAFIKATEGGDHIDEAFRANWVKAASAGIPRGAYHFYYFCTEPAVQARWFLKNLPKDRTALPPVLDAEWNAHSPSCRTRPEPAEVRRQLKVWLDIVERGTGKRPIIYTTPDFYEHNDIGRLDGYELWLRSTAAHPSERYPNEKWTFWQYTGTGKLPGIGGKADINVFAGSAADWKKWLKRRAGR